MTKAFAALAIALFGISPVLADDCYFKNGPETLRFPSPTELVVSGSEEYSCSTSSGGTGVTERVAHCDDGYEGLVAFNDDDNTVTFRKTVWSSTCDDTHTLDLMGN